MQSATTTFVGGWLERQFLFRSGWIWILMTIYVPAFFWSWGGICQGWSQCSSAATRVASSFVAELLIGQLRDNCDVSYESINDDLQLCAVTDMWSCSLSCCSTRIWSLFVRSVQNTGLGIILCWWYTSQVYVFFPVAQQAQSLLERNTWMTIPVRWPGAIPCCWVEIVDMKRLASLLCLCLLREILS